MSWWVAALWGVTGGGLVETLDLYTEVRRRGALPWCKPGSQRRDPTRPARGIYVLGTFLRLLMASGVAAAAGASAMISGPLMGIGIGVSAPLILQRLAAQVPVTAATEPSRADAPVPAATRGDTDEQPIAGKRSGELVDVTSGPDAGGDRSGGSDDET